MTSEEKSREKDKYAECRRNKKIKLAEENEIDHIEYMFRVCMSEFKKFRKYCCSICHKMWRRNGVQKLKSLIEAIQTHKNDQTSELLDECLKFRPIIIEKLGEWACHTCSSNLKKGKMPAQAIANNLELRPLPPEIADLCDLEMRLLAQIIPFSKIVGLKGGAYQGVKGESVCVPIETEKVSQAIKLLPRKLADSELIPLKLKRRLRYRGYYMYQVIRRHAVDKAFHWLVKNNRFYKHNIAYNNDWYLFDEKNEIDQNLQKLTSETNDVNIIKQHDEDELQSEKSTESNDITKQKEKSNDDELEGKNILYDSVFVDEIPSLPPVREDKESFSIAAGEGNPLISKYTNNLEQLAFP